MTQTRELPRGRGRPRQFDAADAIDDAIRVFQQRGYGATSMADLKAATGLSGGSVYKAFKDKKSFFLAAYDRYVERGVAERDAIAGGAGTGREKLRRLLASYAASASGEQGRLGCLVVATAVEVTAVDPEIAQRAIDSVDKLDKLIQDLIRQGKKDGSLPEHLNIRASAAALLCMTQGMRIIGKSEKHRSRVASVVEEAMRLLN